MGRTSIIMIIAFNMTFMMLGFRMSNATSAAYKKYCAYADIEQAGLALESAANLAVSNALLSASPTRDDTALCTDDQFGKATFSIHRIKKYTIYGNQDGDSLYVTGKYPLSGYDPLVDPSPYITCTTSVRVRGNAFSQYVFFSNNENKIEWQTGETCWGRLHTQDSLTINGNPDFKGKVTTKGNIYMKNGKVNGKYVDKPIFEQGATRADISIPTKLTDLTTLGGNSGGPVYKGVDTYVQFLPSVNGQPGKAIVRAAPKGTPAEVVWAYPISTTNITNTDGGLVPKCKIYNSVSELTSSGVMLVQDAALHVKGVLDGKITLGAVDLTTGGTKSSIWIDSSLTYNAPPPSYQNKNNASDDMLGLVATNNIMVSEYINNDNSTHRSNNRDVPDGTPLNNVTIHASMFSQTGGFGAEDYTGRANGGILNVVGGIQQKTRMGVGTSGTSQTGFKKNYDFDTNLLTQDPAGYPKTPFVVQNWVDYVNLKDIKSFWQ